MIRHTRQQAVERLPRIPLQGSIDLTYRCHFDCRHCWIRIPSGADQKREELTFAEIRDIVDQARALGCREWSISGGEPMLRPDFAQIFEYITRKSMFYSLNTNGTLITPEIAQLMRRKGNIMVSLYGATAEVYDHITRLPGSFERAMRGLTLLKEAEVNFTVQIMPMRDNYHQYEEMIRLSKSLSPHWRLGADWLYLRADGNEELNKEIRRQRLKPHEVVANNPPGIWSDNGQKSYANSHADTVHLFEPCLAGRREFHIDPYGTMSFCSFLQDPSVRYDLRQGSFEEAWESFIPSLTTAVEGSSEYKTNCGSCELRVDCRWCPAYSLLEDQCYSSKVAYLCTLAEETSRVKSQLRATHRRDYNLAGLTIRLDADIPMNEDTFRPKFKQFELSDETKSRSNGSGSANVHLSHHFVIPKLEQDLGDLVFCHPPWIIYRKGDSWAYLMVGNRDELSGANIVAIFNQDHSRGHIYHRNDSLFKSGNLNTLTCFPSDLIILARSIARYNACYIHSSGVIMDGQGLLFVGHSGAGKSTIVKLLGAQVELLCDDRNIIRNWPEGFRVHGTWSHGELTGVSPNSAPLRGIYFVEQSQENTITRIHNRREIRLRLLACLMKPVQTADWWREMLDRVEEIAREIPCYRLRFDPSGAIVSVLKEQLQKQRVEREIVSEKTGSMS